MEEQIEGSLYSSTLHYVAIKCQDSGFQHSINGGNFDDAENCDVCYDNKKAVLISRFFSFCFHFLVQNFGVHFLYINGNVRA
jgi:hypothetical protein